MDKAEKWEAEFQEWKHHPVTKALRAYLSSGVEGVKEDFIKGALVMNDCWQSGMKQANSIGRCEMAQMILDLEANQLGVENEE